jgi:serine phosphatase RsbU (regulator of sigma subunit)
MQRTIRSIFLLFFISLFAANLIASQADSLKSLLKTSKEADKFKILVQLSEEFCFEEEGYSYALQAYELSKTLNDPLKEGEGLYTIGRYYYMNEHEVKALEYFMPSLEIFNSLQNKSSIAKLQRAIGNCYVWLDSLDKANEFIQQSLSLSKQIGDKVQIAESLIDYGRLLAHKQQYDQAVANQIEALAILKEFGTKQEIFKAYNGLGRIYYKMGEYQKSIEAYLKEIEIRESLNDMEGVAIASHNLGRTHRTIGNYQLALELYQKSLTLSEKLNDKLFIAANCNDIGLVYENLSRSMLAVKENEMNYKKALEFHEMALSIYKEHENKPKIALSLNNIANCYSRLAVNQFVEKYGEAWEDSLYLTSSSDISTTFGKAFDYYGQALAIFEEIKETPQILNVNVNLGSHYTYTRNWAKAKEHLNKGLRLAKELNSSYDLAIALFHLGESMFRQKNFEAAEQNLLQSLKISEEIGVKDFAMHSNQKLAKIYEQTGNLPLALKHLKAYNLIKDEIFSENSQKAITEMQTKYETEKKEQELKLMKNQDELQKSTIQRQRLMIGLAVGGFLVILAFSVLLINMVRQKQRANKVLEEKNELISHQKQEITDSIRYASRIQNAVLPSATLLSESLKEHFVLFLPRDIVSGDFYWFTKQGDKVVLVAADCTGHGVPGAFMSMLGVSFLYEIVNKENILQPSQILNKLRELIKVTLSQTGKQNEQKDGMDISLSVLDLKNMKLEWAGAFNSLYLVRNSELIEYKADKMPIAIHINDHQSFTNNEIQLVPGDTFYMFSDGFSDQFGGPDGRKFMSKRFKQFLVEINGFTLDEQKEKLLNEHLTWKGQDYEQVDDIIVFGVRV